MKIQRRIIELSIEEWKRREIEKNDKSKKGGASITLLSPLLLFVYIYKSPTISLKRDQNWKILIFFLV